MPLGLFRHRSLCRCRRGRASGGELPEVLGNMTTDAIRSMKSAEGVSLQGDPAEKAKYPRSRRLPSWSAEQSLQTAIAIRDKVVTAYLEIARMQI